jgi:hypothetical protein
MSSVEVGALVGEQDAALAGRKQAKQRASDDNPAGAARHRDRAPLRAVEDDETVVALQSPAGTEGGSHRACLTGPGEGHRGGACQRADQRQSPEPGLGRRVAAQGLGRPVADAGEVGQLPDQDRTEQAEDRRRT